MLCVATLILLILVLLCEDMTLWYLARRSFDRWANSSSSSDDISEKSSSFSYDDISEFSVDEGVQGSDMSRAADDSDADPEHVRSLSKSNLS